MNKFRKILSVFYRKQIFLLDGINNRLFTDRYYKYLKRMGVNFTGIPNYISSKAYIDGQGLKLITIGKDVVISRNVTLLTHDYSPETALHAIGKGTVDRRLHINKSIIIGNNTFIGANSTLLPGTTIGDNCIIGACSVIKGNVPNNSVIIGNPARIIEKTNQLAYKFVKDGSLLKE